MNCPVCKKLMVEQDFGGVKVDVCTNGCKGIWFDWFELTKLDEKNEGVGVALEEALNHPRVGDEGRGEINCPRCGKRMQRHLFQKSREVNVDECYLCGGFFLDSGELKAVRDTRMTDQEEQAYLDKLLAGMPAYQQRKKDLEREGLRRDAARKYARLMRLLT